MWKKLVSLNLAILLVISLFPFRVLAVQEERQPADAQVTSNSIEKLPTPTGLYWDGITMRWEGMFDSIDSLLWFEFEYYFDQDGDGEEVAAIDTSVSESLWQQSYVNFQKLTEEIVQENKSGYYYFKVRAVAEDASSAVSSDWSELSPAYHYEMPARLPTATNLYWEDNVAKWSNLDETIADADRYAVTLYYGTSANMNINELEVLYNLCFDKDYLGWGGSLDLVYAAKVNLLESGYYYFTVEFFSDDITTALDSVISDLSPSYYLEVSEGHPAPTGACWDDGYMCWDDMDFSNVYEAEVFYGESETASLEELTSVHVIQNIFSYDKTTIPGLNEECVYTYGEGYYFFRVKIRYTPNDGQVESEWSSLSPAYYYNGEEGEKLSAPSGLRWNGTNIEWDQLADVSADYVEYEVEYYFGEKCDGTDAHCLPYVGHKYSHGYAGVVECPFNSFANYGLGEGFYFFKVRALSSNITVAADSDWSELSPAFEAAQVEQITIDGESYIATQNQTGDGWYYYYYGEDQTSQLTLSTYSGGPISYSGDLDIYLAGENTVEGDVGFGIYVDGNLHISAISSGGNRYGKLNVAGAANYHAIQATETLRISNSLTATGGGVAALAASEITLTPSWPVKVLKGENAGSASEQSYIGYRFEINDFYDGEIFLHTERIPYTLTLNGNGGVTSDGEETHQVLFTTGTPGSLHLYYQRDVFTNGDKELLGWSETADRSNSQLHPIDEEYSFPEDSLTASLYAVWANVAYVYPGDSVSVDTSSGDGWYFFEVNYSSTAGDLKLYSSVGEELDMVHVEKGHSENVEGVWTQTFRAFFGAYLKSNEEYNLLVNADDSEQPPYKLTTHYFSDLPALTAGEAVVVPAVGEDGTPTSPGFALFTPVETGYYKCYGSGQVAGILEDGEYEEVRITQETNAYLLEQGKTYLVVSYHYNTIEPTPLFGLYLTEDVGVCELHTDQEYSWDIVGEFVPIVSGEYIVKFSDASYWFLSVLDENRRVIFMFDESSGENVQDVEHSFNFAAGSKYYLSWRLHSVDSTKMPSALISLKDTPPATISCTECTNLSTKVSIKYEADVAETITGLIAIYDKSGRMLHYEMITQSTDETGEMTLSISYSDEESTQIGSIQAFVLNGEDMTPLCENWSQEVDFSEKGTGEVWAIIPSANIEGDVWICDAMGAIMETEGFTYVIKDCAGSPSNQAAFVEEAIAAGNVAALMIPVMSSAKIRDAVIQATEAGIAVAYLGYEPSDYTVAGCVYNAFEVTGMFAVQAAEDWVSKRVAEGGNIPTNSDGKYEVAIDTYYNIPDGVHRSNAIKGTVNKSEILELVSETSSYGQTGSLTVAYNNAQSVLNSNPNCHIFVCYEPEQAIGTANAIADYCDQNGADLADYCVISCYAEDTTFMGMYYNALADPSSSAIKGYATYGDSAVSLSLLADTVGASAEALAAHSEERFPGIPVVIPPLLTGEHLADILLSACGFEEYVFEPGYGNSWYGAVSVENIYGYSDRWTWEDENPAIEYKTPTQLA